MLGFVRGCEGITHAVEIAGARLHGRMVERTKPIVHGHTTVSTTPIPVPSVS